MNLCYYGIKAGTTTKEAIKLGNEVNQYSKVLTEEEFDSSTDQSNKNFVASDLKSLYL